MESFPDQLRREQKQYRELYKQATKLFSAAVSLTKEMSILGGMLENFAAYQFQYDRPVIAELANLLSGCSQSMEQAIPCLSSVLNSLNCFDEIKIMSGLEKNQQLAKPPFHQQANIDFIENVAVYEQNREKALVNMSQALANYCIRTGTSLFESAGGIYHTGQCLDMRAPIIDVARRCANLDIGNADICTTCKISRRDFDNRDINAKVRVPDTRILTQLPPERKARQFEENNSTEGRLKEIVRNTGSPTGTKFDSVPRLTAEAEAAPHNIHTAENGTTYDYTALKNIDDELTRLRQEQLDLEKRKLELINQQNNEIFMVGNRAESSNISASTQNENGTEQPIVTQPVYYKEFQQQMYNEFMERLQKEQQARELSMQAESPADAVAPSAREPAPASTQQEPITATVQPEKTLYEREAEPVVEQEVQLAVQPVADSSTFDISYNLAGNTNTASIEPQPSATNDTGPQQRLAEPNAPKPQSRASSAQSSKTPSRAASKARNVFGNIYGDEEESNEPKKKKFKIDIDLGFEEPKEDGGGNKKFSADDFDFV